MDVGEGLRSYTVWVKKQGWVHSLEAKNMMPAEKGLERRVKVDCCAKARTPMMMPEVAHRADRIMKARVAFQYAVGTHNSHS